MKLELKNIKVAAFASEETHCYEGSLYLDGKRVAVLSNRGHGGCDEEHWVDRAAEKVVKDHFAGLPEQKTDLVGKDGEVFMIQPSLEIWCSDRVSDFLILRDVKQTMKKKVVAIHSGKEWSFRLPPARLAEYRDILEKKHPGIVFLNGMSDAEVLANIRKVAA